MNSCTRLARHFSLLAMALSVVGCASYKQNIMFKTPEGFQSATVSEEAARVVADYRIAKNDYLNVEVYSNNGERIIDPNPELTSNPQQQRNNDQYQKINYLVDTDGKVKLPMIGEIAFEGLTLRQAELAAQKEYAKFFKEPYVVVNFVNKRAVLLGATGGQVIPLVNQNVRLTEVLALGEGLGNTAKAHNIRILRGDDVFVVDLSTVEGYRTSNMLIQPGDIIYVEPVRRPATEALRDYSGFLSVIVSLASLVVVIVSIN